MIIFSLKFINNDFMHIFVLLSYFLGFIFRLFQTLVMIDFLQVWNEKWNRRHRRNVAFVLPTLIALSLSFFLANLVVIMISYDEFWLPGCFLNKIYIVLMVGYLISNIGFLIFRYK